MTDDVHPRLRQQAADYAAELLKAVTSPFDLVLPGSSKIVDFFIDQALPRREERFAQFLTELSRRLKVIEERLGESCFGPWSPEKQALFEDGARAATRSLSNERIEQVAGVVADGLSEDDAGVQRTRLLLDLISELSDLDVIVLASKTELAADADWSAKHGPALVAGRVERPFTYASHDEYLAHRTAETEKALVTGLQIDRLIKLGLMAQAEQHYLDASRTLRGPPRIARRVDYPKITPLGLLVLQRLGVWDGVMPRVSISGAF